MADTIKTIHVEPDSELGRIVNWVSEALVMLEKDGVRYRLDRVSAAGRPSSEQVERSIAGILRAAGAWSDIDAEAYKAYVRKRRKAANRPSVRW